MLECWMVGRREELRPSPFNSSECNVVFLSHWQAQSVASCFRGCLRLFAELQEGTHPECPVAPCYSVSARCPMTASTPYRTSHMSGYQPHLELLLPPHHPMSVVPGNFGHRESWIATESSRQVTRLVHCHNGEFKDRGQVVPLASRIRKQMLPDRGTLSLGPPSRSFRGDFGRRAVLDFIFDNAKMVILVLHNTIQETETRPCRTLKVCKN